MSKPIELLKEKLNSPASVTDADLLAAYDNNRPAILNDLIALYTQNVPVSQIEALFKELNFTPEVSTFKNLAAIPGHPLQLLGEEAAQLEKRIDESLNSEEAMKANYKPLWDISLHDMKKADLLYPTLKVKYGYAAPSLDLWDKDIAIRRKYTGLMLDPDAPDWDKNMEEALKQMKDMLWVEDHLLYPLTAATFSKEIWEEVYQNQKDYSHCLNVPYETWPDGESLKRPLLPDPDQKVVLNGGVLSAEQLNSILNALPLEITFVDIDNMNRYFNIGHKAFKRPTLSLNHEVFDCHPHQVAQMVKGMFENFRSGKKDRVEIWMKKEGKPYFVIYQALRDEKGNYLGTLEMCQPMEFAEKHFAEAASLAGMMK